MSKIIHIINIPWYSGLAAYAIDMANSQKESGSEIMYAVNSDSVLHEKLAETDTVIPLYGRDIVGTLKSLVVVFRASKDADTLVAHTGSSLFIAVICAKLRGIKVYRVRSEAGSISKNIFNVLLHQLCKAVIVPTLAINADVLQLLGSDVKIKHLPAYVDTAYYKSVDKKNPIVIGMLGRLDKVKGHDIAIKALAHIIKNKPEIELHIAGREEGVKWDSLNSLVIELGLQKNVRYLGYQTSENIKDFIDSCHLAILPSIGSEAISRVALEWMASGIPVIASDVGCLSETIDDGINGYIVPPKDIEKLSESIEKILKNDNINIMGMAARDYVVNNHSPKIYKKYLNEVFE